MYFISCVVGYNMAKYKNGCKAVNINTLHIYVVLLYEDVKYKYMVRINIQEVTFLKMCFSFSLCVEKGRMHTWHSSIGAFTKTGCWRIYKAFPKIQTRVCLKLIKWFDGGCKVKWKCGSEVNWYELYLQCLLHLGVENGAFN